MYDVPFYALSPTVDYWATVISAVLLVVTVIYCAMRTSALKSALPFIILLGSAGTIIMEPMVDSLAPLVFPNEGVWIIINVMGHPMPVYNSLIYTFYWAGGVLFVVDAISDGLTMKKWMSSAALFIGSALLIELLPIYYDMWRYYGVQPLKFGGFPLWWAFVNTCGVMGTAAVIVLLKRLLRGSEEWLLVPLFPCMAVGIHTAAAVPGYIATSSTDNYALALLGTTLSMVASIVILWLFGRVVCTAEAATDQAGKAAAAQ